ALREVAELASKGFAESWLTKSFVEIGRTIYEIDRREEIEARDHDAIEAQLRRLQRSRCWGWKGSGHWYCRGEGLTRQEVLDRRRAGRAELDAALDACDADLAAPLFVELWGIVDEYEALKKSSGKLDFLDLL